MCFEQCRKRCAKIRFLLCRNCSDEVVSLVSSLSGQLQARMESQLYNIEGMDIR